ncbi:hypothetical protein HYFRA_00001965 [Hymenoscyphus fraxineus]|uniref:Uncharacterized protein n=1 Tax=Hymenoscyphus fraxineus TaxID=746836 RepID=A0A9N9KMS9_9HELO|nr:hypothetical protein HYFRA_00001965 [Hymenoscyphus fraxineus]
MPPPDLTDLEDLIDLSDLPVPTDPKAPTKAQRQATDYVLQRINIYKQGKDRGELMFYTFTDDFGLEDFGAEIKGWNEDHFKLVKKSVNKELRKTLRN